MLVALDNAGERVLADRAAKGEDYVCPGCGEPVVLKRGRIVLPHFAHRPDADCTVVSDPETAAHMAMKQTVWELFRRERWVNRCELEWIVGDRRADVWLDTAVGPIAVECQVSPLTVEELADKLQDYTDRGIASLYLVHESVFAALFEGAEVRVPAWVLALHALYRGRVYVWEDGEIVPVHLHAVMREPTGYGTRERRLKTMRRVMVGELIRWLELRCSMTRSQYGLLAGKAYAAAMFEDRIFWL